MLEKSLRYAESGGGTMQHGDESDTGEPAVVPSVSPVEEERREKGQDRRQPPYALLRMPLEPRDR